MTIRSINPAGSALCTWLNDCSGHFGLVKSSMEGGLRPPFFNNPAGSALCTLLRACSDDLGLAKFSEECGLRPPF